jgi:long-subunit acyl-CoA synthetase (AMP-forming)
MGETNALPLVAPKPSNVAVIMYTSGTTGNPKGVMISHENIIGTIAGVLPTFETVAEAGDVFLAYLPLAHIFEMVTEITMAAMGVIIGYGNPHTLTDTGVKLKRPESSGDAGVLRPTVMIFAPAVLDKVYQAVQAKMTALPGPVKTLFGWGVANGASRFEDNKIGASGFYNMIFKSVQKIVGGRLKIGVSGSAPLSAEIQKFVQTVLNIPIRQGYGLTETCAASCLAEISDNTVCQVGPPLLNTTIRLADWEEGNYRNADESNPDIGMRRGEVLIGGPGVTLGYYVDPSSPDPEMQKKNQEDWVVIDGIRFFRSGDIGQITKNGSLQIIDRKKDLWKGPQGEYVALTKVEAALKLCPYAELSMCYGRTGANFPIALICPAKPKLKELAKEFGLDASDIAALCANPKVEEKISTECKKVCKAQKLAEFETPKKFGLVADTWTPENDMLTAALKMKRPAIAARDKAVIDKCYA